MAVSFVMQPNIQLTKIQEYIICCCLLVMSSFLYFDCVFLLQCREAWSGPVARWRRRRQDDHSGTCRYMGDSSARSSWQAPSWTRARPQISRRCKRASRRPSVSRPRRRCASCLSTWSRPTSASTRWVTIWFTCCVWLKIISAFVHSIFDSSGKVFVIVGLPIFRNLWGQNVGVLIENSKWSG